MRWQGRRRPRRRKTVVDGRLPYKAGIRTAFSLVAVDEALSSRALTERSAARRRSREVRKGPAQGFRDGRNSTVLYAYKKKSVFLSVWFSGEDAITGNDYRSCVAPTLFWNLFAP